MTYCFQFSEVKTKTKTKTKKKCEEMMGLKKTEKLENIWLEFSRFTRDGDTCFYLSFKTSPVAQPFIQK